LLDLLLESDLGALLGDDEEEDVLGVSLFAAVLDRLEGPE